MTKSLQHAWNRVERRKRSHKLRNTMLVIGGIAEPPAQR